MESWTRGDGRRLVRSAVRRCTLGSLLVAVALSSAFGGSFVAMADENGGDTPTGVEVQPTVVQQPTAVPTVPPTAVPVPTQAPAPTHVPIPTQAPPPTEVPVPTATLPPTEVPAPIATLEPVAPEPTATTVPTPEPTIEPTATPTVEPTATATPGPTPSPTPSPTPEPAIPFEPGMTCAPAPGGPAVAGDQAWAFLDCQMVWQTKDVSKVELDKPTPPAGWEIVPVNDRQRDDPAVIRQDPANLVLKDDNAADDGYFSSRFAIASRVSCTAEPAAAISLGIEATSGEKPVVESVSRNVSLSVIAARRPDVTVRSAVFDKVDPAENDRTSTGVITLDYSNASADCGWSIVTTVSDFVSEEGTIPASEMSLVEVTGVPGLTSVQDGGEIDLVAAPEIDAATSGTIILTVSMPMPANLIDGQYLATITARANSP